MGRARRGALMRRSVRQRDDLEQHVLDLREDAVGGATAAVREPATRGLIAVSDSEEKSGR